MNEQIPVEQVEEMRNAASTLLHQGEHFGLAGLLPQAIALLTQSWELAHAIAPDLANAAAWETAWLLVRQHAYTDAAAWFARVTAPVTNSALWPATRQALNRSLPPSSHATVTVHRPHVRVHPAAAADHHAGTLRDRA